MHQNELKFCVLIPCYEMHANLLLSTIKNYIHLNIDIIIIDDGSSDRYARIIEDVALQTKSQLIKNENNGGKGDALSLGLKMAYQQGYTHSIQIDADGQHDSSSIHALMDLAKRNPHLLISGRPIYDKSVPKGRLIGRYVTHVWVWIETLSLSLVDSMCGYRVYPLKETHALLKESQVGKGMDFDTEIMVKLYWQGVKSKFIDVKVIYPEDGVSYFKLLKDNWRITKMHTRLFFGMIPRVPTLLLTNSKEKKWDQAKEKGPQIFMKITLYLFFVFGENFLRLFAKPLSFYYSLFAQNSKTNSKVFRLLYIEECKRKNIVPLYFNTYAHINSFANTIIDKFCVWKGLITRDNIFHNDLDDFYRILEKKEGALFISSHYGNIEVARAIGKLDSKIKFNALMYTENAKKIMNILNTINPKTSMNIISVAEITPDLGIELKKRTKDGELLFCMGDRLTVNSKKSIKSSLLHREIELPFGPFLLGYILKCPIYAFHCYRENNKFRIRIKEITQKSYSNHRESKYEAIQKIAGSYSQELNELIMKDPIQWYNFNSTWKI